MSAVVLALAIASVCHTVLGVNIESTDWKFFSRPNRSEGFGYRVIQHSPSSLLVSDPLQQYVNRKGEVYECMVDTDSCSLLPINVPDAAVNMSLGLSMTKTETSNKTWICGPTVPKECPGVTQYGGMCFSLNSNYTPLPSLEECQLGTDISFLLDGSGSVHDDQFSRMKTFVKELIKKLLDHDTRFSIAQYSTDCTIHIKFNQFRTKGWEEDVNKIKQMKELTMTAKAIQKVVTDGFASSAGARPDAKRILIVITDGEAQDSASYPDAVEKANSKNIKRFAIGIGTAFNNDDAKQQLKAIASLPTSNHMFHVDSFEALETIKSNLEKSIIAVEGTQTTGDSTIMQFAQNGFSAALVSSPEERLLVSVIGAYDWRGGYQDIPLSTKTPTVRRMGDITPNSYLGYSMTVAVRNKQNYIVMGAPRFEHKGLLMVIFPDDTRKNFTQSQIGAYFGAEVCLVDLNENSNTDLILTSAPMYTEGGREGAVFVYKFSRKHSQTEVSETGVSLLGMEGQRGRFGSALASLADLNGDGIRDVAVGAPLEDGGQGSVYIFNGRTGGLNPTYSQRIEGSAVRSGLRFFGLTVAQSALDQSGDGLPDIAVGSKGAVLLLRFSCFPHPYPDSSTSMLLVADRSRFPNGEQAELKGDTIQGFLVLLKRGSLK
ncbi:hypothetical protein ACEWY4_003670 [Coilia grayii]|uniref:VWFA domain-containing protein n=1 Tax=Coilia grayii TaxID=363190 RepID=A0ABD1KRW5_9TELE